jgi:tetratricopeptide (TPR) repeat protein
VLNQQYLFNAFCYVAVGFLGHALIGWEVGKKGLLRVGLEGPTNRRVSAALLLFAGMVLWQTIGRLQSPYSSWKDLWPPVVAVVAFLVSRALVPRSLRIYNRAKYLHETTWVGEWRGVRNEAELEQARQHPRLLEAERLYREASSVQQRLAAETNSEEVRLFLRRNIASVHTQLALLYLQQALLKEAAAEVTAAVSLAETLHQHAPDDTENAATLSGALFRMAQTQQALGDRDSAVTSLRKSLSLDERLGDLEGARASRLLLEELLPDAKANG